MLNNANYSFDMKMNTDRICSVNYYHFIQNPI
jgi:hypothetical protein